MSEEHRFKVSVERVAQMHRAATAPRVVVIDIWSNPGYEREYQGPPGHLVKRQIDRYSMFSGGSWKFSKTFDTKREAEVAGEKLKRDFQNRNWPGGMADFPVVIGWDHGDGFIEYQAAVSTYLSWS